MKAFATLLDRLTHASSSAAKRAHLIRFLNESADPERGWALAAVLGAVKPARLTATQLRALADGRLDRVLFDLSHDFVGDLAETLALSWERRPGANREPELCEIIDAVSGLRGEALCAQVERLLDALDTDERWAFLKLLTGGAAKLLTPKQARRALSVWGGKAQTELEAVWSAQSPPYTELFAWLTEDAPAPVVNAEEAYRPVMLARDFDPGAMTEPFTPERFAAEWNWDGARVQAVCAHGALRLFARGGDDITEAFPELADAFARDACMDGVLILHDRNGSPAPYAALEARLKRKSITLKQARAQPASFIAFDLLALDGSDLRDAPLRERRAHLEQLLSEAQSVRVRLSRLIAFSDLDDLRAARAAQDEAPSDGIILKRWDGTYFAGRRTDDWLRQRGAPHVVDAVLLYVEQAAPGAVEQFTLGVWTHADGARVLVPVGKADNALSEEEIAEIHSYARANTVERFGPVRSLAASEDAGLVVELSFKAVEHAARRKAGLALREARVTRLLLDKTPGAAADISALSALAPAHKD